MNRVLSAAFFLAAAGSALAQVGTGHALDRNLQRGSGGMNRPGPSFSDELRFRNAVVTGNAPGGFHFRGDVGYRAPGEFEGRLGSDALFGFRRDSVYSGLAGMGVRGTDAIQYQFALTTGNTPPASLGGSGEFLRAGASRAPLTGAAVPAVTPIDPAIRASAAPQPESMLWELRSPAAYVSNRGMEPALLGVVQSPRGDQIALTASPLRGLNTVPVRSSSELAQRMENKDLARQDLSLIGPGEEKPAVAPAGDARPRAKSPYEQLMDQMAERDRARRTGDTPGRVKQGDPATAPQTPEQAEWRDKFEDLRKMLEGGSPAKPDVDDELIELLKSPEGRLRALAADGFDSYARHMKTGQDHMAAGRLFQAEERFTAALSLKAGDPMASIGRVHAQLGNSLFLSASVNLRKLLIAHPELIGVRYAAEILPSRERTAMTKSRLRELIQREASMKRDAGLLLAYLGFQSDDQAAVAAGFDAMDSAEGQADEQLARLSGVLRQVWMPSEGTP